MGLLDGKQIRNTTVSLDKLSGVSGIVTFTASATMSFQSGAVLRRDTVDILVNTDVVNKEYVDAVAAGLNPKESSRVIYNSDVTSEGGYTYSNGVSGVGATLSFTGLTIDGISSFSTNERVIINSSTDKYVNGIYNVSVLNAGAISLLTRSTDFDGSPATEVNGGEFSFVTEGLLYGDTGWVVSSPDTTAIIGVTDIVWVQFSAAGVITAGDGLSKNGTQLDVNTGLGLTISSDSVAMVWGGTSSGLTFSNNAVGVVVDGNTIVINSLGQLVSTTEGDISGVTAGEGLSGGGTQGFVTLDVNLLALGGLTFSGDDIAVDYLTLSSQLAGMGLTSNGGTLSSDLLINGGLTYSGNQIGVTVDGSTIQIIDGYLVSTTQGDISGVTAGNGLSGGGTQGFVTLDVNLGVDSGLTFSGDDIIIDTNIAGNGLDFVSGVLTVNTSEITSTLAGNGLTANSGALDVNVNSDSLEIVSDVVRLKDTITGDRTFQDSVTVGGNLTVNGTVSYIYTENLMIEDNIITLNATFSGSPFLNAGIEVVRGSSQSAALIWDESLDLWAAGLSGSTSTIITEAGIGLVKSGNTLSTDLLVNGGLTYSGNQIGVTVDGSTIQIIDGYLVSTTQGDISGVTAGEGLSGGGTQGFVTLDVNTGLGLTISSNDVAMVWGGTSSGLTFSNNAVGVVVDNTSLVINSLGQLSVVSGSSIPVYQYGSPLASTGNDSQTGLTLSFIPNNYSRVEVFVNGQKQRLGDGVSTADCYFGPSPKALNTLTVGDELYWNGIISGFQLTTIDVVEVIYES